MTTSPQPRQKPTLARRLRRAAQGFLEPDPLLVLSVPKDLPDSRSRRFKASRRARHRRRRRG